MGLGKEIEHAAEDVGKAAADVALGAAVLGLKMAEAAEEQRPAEDRPAQEEKR